MIPKRRLAVAAGLALAGVGGVAWSCASVGCSPNWSISAPDYQCAGRIALAPGNDSRINLLLLIRSLRPPSEPRTAPPAADRAPADWDSREYGNTFVTWKLLRAGFWPHPEAEAAASEAHGALESYCTDSGPDRTPLADNDAGRPTIWARQDFVAALAAEPRLPSADRARLETLRAQVGCSKVEWGKLDGGVGSPSPVARDYLAYLKATEAFYAGDWAAARAGYAGLARSKSAWVRETAAYMPIRIGLRAAIAGALDEYGDFAGSAKVDRPALDAARAAIAAYLQAWPQGRYANSARGLVRRVQWLGGDRAGLARSYEQLAATIPGDKEEAADLVEEIDARLMPGDDAIAEVAHARDTPLMLATADLRLMRPVEGKAVGLSREDLAAQQAAFAGHAALFGFLGATRAWYAGEPPREILAAIPDTARQPSPGPLEFSRQVLRGMALGRAGDPAAAAFWRDLLAGADGRYQRPLVELALAQHWTNSGRIADVFAPGSPIADSPTREELLRMVAPPAILRATARDASRPGHERDLARFTLLAKDLTRGFAADFVRDVALVPADAATDGSIGWMAGSDAVPAGLFVKGAWSDGFACPAIAETAAILARTPADARARLCLGDFLRLNGFDQLGSQYQHDTGDGLGRGPDLFPGTPSGRDAIYAALIADRKTPAELRAYALYRAIMCYAPSGYSSCAAPGADPEKTQVPKPQRKAWFEELRKTYPKSRWAQALRYWW